MQSHDTQSNKRYRIAGAVASSTDLTTMSTQNKFAESLVRLFATNRPKRLIETGTYRGTGSTTVIAEALASAGLHDATFYSIEVNANNVARAKQHLASRGYNVQVQHGLSVPRRLLPSREQIEAMYVRTVEADAVFVDHQPEKRAELYFGETDFPGVEEDMLGSCLKAVEYSPDFLLLDSGGHMGNIEFNYVLPLLKSPCIIALDDINHVKHYRSMQQILADDRFALIERSDEKFGWCMARFVPAKKQAEAA
jgi:hypothetical protein